MMIETNYKERLRVLLILYFFSETHPGQNEYAKVFRTETRIQKINFLLRYPSYLSYELLNLHEETGLPHAKDTKNVIKQIFSSEEPKLRTDEMKRFFYGAYEELDDIIGFLKSVQLIDVGKYKVGLKTPQKEYYITNFGQDKIEKALLTIPSAQWYIQRCQLIKTYFGDLSGNALRVRQYEIEEYKTTLLNQYIADIEDKVRMKYLTLFDETL